MNKKVLAIVVLTIIALVALTLFSYGPFSKTNISSTVDPASLKPQSTEQVPVSNQNIQFNSYHNKDLKENFFGFEIPQDWQLGAGQTAGSYNVTFASVTGRIELKDVPDNSTLELYLLSQEEPQLKKDLPEYKRLDYQKLSINKNDAYQLTYQHIEAGMVQETLATYIAGQDQMGVITWTAKQDLFAQFLPTFTVINNSFNWENT